MTVNLNANILTLPARRELALTGRVATNLRGGRLTGAQASQIDADIAEIRSQSKEGRPVPRPSNNFRTRSARRSTPSRTMALRRRTTLRLHARMCANRWKPGPLTPPQAQAIDASQDELSWRIYYTVHGAPPPG